MLELDVIHTRGSRTFIYTALSYGWWLTLIGLGFAYLSYAVYMGPLMERTTAFLLAHEDWYVEKDPLALWIAMIAVSCIFIAYLRANVLFRQYKFTLDEHAFRLQRGLFRIREVTFPYNQISNVNIEQPYHYRMLGLAQLDIISSSDSISKKKKRQSAYLIPLIDKSIAKELRLQLMKYGSGKRNPYDDMYDDEDEYDEFEDDEEDNNEDGTEDSVYYEEEYIEVQDTRK